MTFLSLKVASAIVLAIASVQAAPLERRCVGSECYQAASSGDVEVGSTTSIQPITDVTPITRYQPIVQTHAAIVDSDCDHGDYGRYENYGGYGNHGGYGSYGRYGDYGYGDYDSYGLGYRGRGYRGYYGRRFMKRQDDASAMSTSTSASSGNLLFSQLQQPDGAADASCEASVPAQNVDLGSQVSIQPTNQVLPSTTYQNHVQALDSNIDAAPAQDNSLPQQHISLGSNVSIQPTTQVLPQTTYQPEVNQLTTAVDAAPQQDQSLPQSSVNLGSSVHIKPTVQVTPLTTFQPSIQSLPFIINSQPCIDDSAFAGSSTSGAFSSTRGGQYLNQGVGQQGFGGQKDLSSSMSSSMGVRQPSFDQTSGQFGAMSGQIGQSATSSRA
ncbi:hypothetical protein EDD11_003539 [Mortierella claussenii]|nr:hypothetical protein EDD11_003539 [Mortierella claussenii]